MSASSVRGHEPRRANLIHAILGAAPADDPLVLTPLRAHYLKRELVTLEFVQELGTLDSPSALSLLGPPFVPKSRFVNGVPQAAPPPGSAEAIAEARGEEASVDLPFLRFVFHHFVLSFPFLANCPSTFFSHKLQPFVYSFVSRNISTSDDREEATKRKRIAGKIEKHLGLVLSAAIKVVENDGREEVVRIVDDGSSHTALPASQESKYGTGSGTRSPPKSPVLAGFGKPSAGTEKQKEDETFSINIVAVRNTVTKSRMRSKTHEEFIIRTRQKGRDDVFVARRYGDFTRLAETVSSSARVPNYRSHAHMLHLQLRSECIEEAVPSPPAKDRRSTGPRSAPTPPSASSSPQLGPQDGTSASGSSTPADSNSRIPSLARERNRLTLRAYLRRFLLNPVLAGSSAFQSFVTESPIELNAQEKRDVEIREEMDRIREQEAKSFRSEVDGRVAELEGYIREFREELVERDGLSGVFGTIRTTERVEELPVRYRKVMEWARIA